MPLFCLWKRLLQSHAHFRRVVWTACLALAFTPLMGLAIFPSNHVVLILPLVLILTLAWERWKRLRILAILFILAFALLVPFGIYLQSVYVYEPSLRTIAFSGAADCNDPWFVLDALVGHPPAAHLDRSSGFLLDELASLSHSFC